MNSSLPNLIFQFKQYLLGQKEKPSYLTVKNYIVDVKKFVNWYESKYQRLFDPAGITPQIIDEFKSEKVVDVSVRSVERYLSSLRKFFHFLKLEGIVVSSPFEKLTASAEALAKEDPYRLKDFKSNLYVYNAAHLTIKNYLIDIKQFLKWAEEVSGVNQAWDVKDKNLLAKIDSFLVKEYKQRLLNSGFSPASINRKLSSIRRYLNWAQTEGLLGRESLTWDVRSEISEARNLDLLKSKSQEIPLPSQEPPTSHFKKSTEYSNVPPVRLSQKIGKGVGWLVNRLFDKTVIEPLTDIVEMVDHLIWRVKGKPIFKRIGKTIRHQPLAISNFTKAFYAPTTISTKYFPWYKKLWFHARYTRPQWYKVYTSYSMTHYFHLAILIILMSAIGFGLYRSFVEEPKQKAPVLAALPTAPPRILSFQGLLTDTSDNPITSTKQLRFAIYNHPTASGAALLWQEVDTVSPDSDGVFSILLGNNTSIGADVFAQNAALYLGVTVETDSELTPRQQLATVAYAANAETLQGLLPITGSGATQKNVVLALNSSGNLMIGGSASPTFQATGGEFKLSGQPLTLMTNVGSNGNIVLSPDGIGKIDLQKPIVNTTKTGNFVPGSVEINDTLAVIASESARASFIVDNKSTGDIMTASQSGTTKFLIDNAGSVGLGKIAPLERLDVYGNATVSGNLTLYGAARNVQTRALNTLTLGGATTGNIVIDSGSSLITLSDPTTFSSTLTLPNSNTLTGVSNYAQFSNGISVGGGTTYYLTSAGVANLATINAFSLAGNITVNQDVDIIPAGTTGTNDLGSSSLPWDNVYANNIYGGNTGTFGYWQRALGALSPTNITDDILLGATATSSALVRLAGTNNVPADSYSWINSGNVGIGTTAPSSFKLEVDGNVGSSTDNTYDLGSSARKWANVYTNNLISGNLGVSGFAQGSVIFAGAGGTLSQNNANFYWKDSTASLGIGTTNPTHTLDVNGDIRGRGKTPTSVGLLTVTGYPTHVDVQGRYAYVVNDTSSTLRIIDVSDPTSPKLVGSVATGANPKSVQAQGRYVYVSTITGATFEIYDALNPTSPSLVESFNTPVKPYTFHIQGRYAYLVSSETSSTLKVIDIANPVSPTEIGSVATADWPVKIYVRDNYAYVIAYGTHYLQIFNVSNPASPSLVSSTSTEFNPRGLYVQGRFAYVANYSSDSFQVFDISDPVTPVLKSTVPTATNPRFVYVQGIYAYVLSNGTDKLQIFDVTDPTSPAEVSSTTTGAYPRGVYVQGRYAYIVNADDDTFQVFDVGGAYIQQLEAGGIETTTLSVRNDLQVGNNAVINGALQVTRGISSYGPVSVYGGSGVFVINQDGNTGIGTRNPSKLLEVSGSDATARITQTRVDQTNNWDLGYLTSNKNLILKPTTDALFALKRASDDGDMFILDSSNGNLTAAGKGYFSDQLKVDTVTDGGTLVLGRKSGNPTIKASTGGVWMIMDSDGTGAGSAALNWFVSDNVILARGGGNVGIGTTNPGAKLDIAGNLVFSAATPTISASTTDTSLSIDSNGSGALNLNNTAIGDVLIAGGSDLTGCTVANSTGNLTCAGTITGGATGTVGYWTRATTTLSPATANDVVSISSNDTTNPVLSLTSTGASVNAFLLTASSTTTGNVGSIVANGLTTGNALFVSSTSTAGGVSGASYLLNLSRSGANSNTAHTAYGLYSSVTNTNATSGTNIAGYFSATGATTANYGLLVAAGNVGIGITDPGYLLEMYDATNTPVFALSDDDVAHGVTTIAQTDTFFHLSSISTTVGGAQITGLASATGIALGLKGIQSSDPADTTPAISLIGAKANGTGVQDLGAAETVFQVANNDNAAALTILGNGNVGIGTTNPLKKLHVGAGADTPVATEDGLYVSNAGITALVVRNSTNDIELSMYADTVGAIVGAGTNHKLFLRTNNANKVTIDTAGYVGIGTTAPARLFHLTSVNPDIVWQETGVTTDNSYWEMFADSEQFVAKAANDAWTVGTQWLVVDRTGTTIDSISFPNGNVGIGTTNPLYKLEVNGTGYFSGAVTMGSTLNTTGLTNTGAFTTSGGIANINVSSNYATNINTGTSTGAVSIGNSLAGALTLASGASSSLTITNANLTLSTTGASGANGVINLTSALALGNTTTSAFNLTTSTDLGGGDELLQVGDSAATFLTIKGDGNVGIGTTSPSQTLEVNGNTLVDGLLGVGAAATYKLDVTSAAISRSLNVSNLNTGSIAYAGYFSKSGAATTGVGLYATATGATNNYAAIFDQGNVGIGTTAPSAKLDINGNIRFDNTARYIEFSDGAGNWDTNLYRTAANRLQTEDLLTFFTASAGTQILGGFVNLDTQFRWTVDSNGKIQWGAGNASLDTNLYRVAADKLGTDDTFYVGGNVGIGTTDPLAPLHITSGTSAKINLEKTGTSAGTSSIYSDGQLHLVSSGGNVYIDDSPIVYDGSSAMFMSMYNTGTLAIKFDTNGASYFNGGNVGIGTTAPLALLDVNGTARVTTLNATSAIQLNGTSINTGGTLTNVAYLNQANAFTANQNFNAGFDVDDAFVVADGGALTTSQTATFNGNLFFGTSTGILASGGNVGIGTTNPQYALDIVGTSALWQSVYGTDDGLVGYWPFSEGTGTKAYDRSPYASDGTITPGTGGWTSGKYGNAYNFDGAATYADAGNDASLNLTEFTIEAWIKITSLYDYNGLIRKQVGGGSENYSMYIKADGGVHMPILWTNATRTSQADAPAGTLAAGTWYHVVQSYKSGQWRFYRNAVIITDITTVSLTPQTNAGSLIISLNEASRWFNGIIDEVRIYNRALSADEIKTHYLRGKELGKAIAMGTSTTAGKLYGLRSVVTDTGVVTTGTDTTYGSRIDVSRTLATGGTLNNYGEYLNVAGTFASGTGIINNYGLYSSVTGDTTGTSTAIGGYFSATGADNNYGLLVANGNVGIGTTSPLNNLDVVNTIRMTSTAVQTDIPADTTIGNLQYFANDQSSGRQVVASQILSAADGNWSGADGNYPYYSAGLRFSTYTASALTERMRINGAGNVGIGTTNPGNYKLAVSGGTGSVGMLLEADTDNSNEADQPSLVLSQDGGAVAGQVGFFDSTNAFTIYNSWASAGGDVQIGAGGRKSDLVILGATGGNVGIGDNDPDYLLELYDTTNTPTFALSDDDVAHGVTTIAQTDTFFHLSSISTTVGGAQITGLASATGIALGLKGIQSSDPADTTPAISLIGAKANGTGVQDLGAAETVFQVANNDDAAALTILGNGNVGIGYTAPRTALDINTGGVRAGSYASPLGDFYLASGATTGFNLLTYAGTVITAAGNVGIGTTSPLALLHLGTNSISNTGDISVRIERSHSGGSGQYDRGLLLHSVQTANATGNLTELVVSPEIAGGVTQTTAYGSYTFPITTGNIGTWYGQAIAAKSGSGTVTTFYGLYLDSLKTTGVTTAYGIYQAGTSDLNYFGGNVGIGTGSPNWKFDTRLDLAKTNTGDNQIAFFGSNEAIASNPLGLLVGWTGGASSATRYTYLQSTEAGSTTNSLVLQRWGGNVGIGTTSPDKPLDVESSGTTASTEYLLGAFHLVASGGVDLGYYIGAGGSIQEGRARSVGSIPLALGTTSYPQALYILNSNGNVGIGTAAPGKLLQVGNENSTSQGIVRFAHKTGGNWRAWDMGTGDATAYGALDNFGIKDTQQSVASLVFNTSGRVGIGTTGPAYALHVVGTTGFVGGAWPYVYFGGTDTGIATVLSRTQAAASFYFGETADTGGYVFRGSGATTIEGNVSIAQNLTLANVKAIYLKDTAGGSTGSLTHGADNWMYLTNSYNDVGMSFRIDSNVANAHWSWYNYDGAHAHNEMRLHHDGSMVLRGALEQNGNPDIAEYIPVSDSTIEAGDLVVADPTSPVQATKSTQPYQSSLLGVISTKPGITLNAAGVIDDDPTPLLNQRPLVLVGRVPVKVTSENGPIAIGDPITSSNIPGVGMKATRDGQIIGKALEAFDGSNPTISNTPYAISRIMVFVNLSWYDPDVYLADSGELVVNSSVPSIDQLTDSFETQIAKIRDTRQEIRNKNNNQLISRIGGFSELVTAKLKAGLVEAENTIINGVLLAATANIQQLTSNTLNALTANINDLTVNSLTIATDTISIGGQTLHDYIAQVVNDTLAVQGRTLAGQEIVSPIAEVDRLAVNIISPLASDSAISVSFHNSKFEIHNSRDASGSAVATIDSSGNASFSGQLAATTANLQQLTTNNLTANEASLSAVRSQKLEVADATVSGTLHADKILANNYIDISTYSAQLAYIENFTASFGQFNQGLMSLGATSLADTAIIGQLSINGSFILAENSINVLGGTLELQPLRQGALAMMGGAVYIDTDGNVRFGENATFEKDVTVKGNLAANVISPIPDSDLVIQLGQRLASGSALIVKNASDSAVMKVDQEGNLTASGSGQFAKLKLDFVPEALALSPTEVIATGSAGIATMSAQQSEITINNPLITEKSLIYITPIGDTGNQVLYLLRQVAGKSFTVGVNQSSLKKIPFNWLLVN